MNYKNNQIPKKNHFSPMFYPLPYMPNHLYNFISQPNQFSLPLSMNIMNHNTNKPKNVIEENNEKEKKVAKFNMNQISKKLFIVHDNNKSEKIRYMKTTI